MSSDKNEILFKQYGINYNTLDSMFRKGSILLREAPEAAASLETLAISPGPEAEASARPTTKPKKAKAFDGTHGKVVRVHEDLIGKGWWEKRGWLLA